MTAPARLYESQSDRARERAVVAAFAAKHRLGYVMSAPLAAYDATLLDGAFVSAFVEVKARRVARDAYPSVILDIEKLTGLVSRSRATGIPALLLVQYTDGLRWVRLDDRLWPVVIGGRTDRGDARDEEPCIAIPIADLSPL